MNVCSRLLFGLLLVLSPALQSQTDSSRIKLLLTLSQALPDQDSKKAEMYLQEALILSNKSGNIHWSLKTYNALGRLAYNLGNYNKANSYCDTAIDVNKGMSDPEALASSYNLLGDILRVSGNFPLALAKLHDAAAIFEKTGDKSGEAANLLGIGNIYFAQKQFKIAAETSLKSLQIRVALKDSMGVADCCNNIGAAYKNANDFENAFLYYKRALKIYEHLSKKSGISFIYNNMSSCYLGMGKPQEGLAYGLKSLQIDEELNSRDDIAFACANISEAYMELKEYDNALKYINRSLSISRELRDKEGIEDGYAGLASIYEMKKDYRNAYLNYQLYSGMKDSLFNKESSRQIAEMNAKYETGKKEQAILLLNKAKEQQRIVIYAGAAFIVLLGVLALFIFRSNKIKQKANRLLSIQKQEIFLQKEMVDVKNKEILDSIHYAQKIQHAILPSDEEFRRLLPVSFVFFQPKDIVSGDFYWISKQEDYVFFAVADCTGHGVPGGFMSMLGSSLLNEVVNEKKIYDPADILDMLRIKIVLALKQKEVMGENKDGMDMCLCRYHAFRRELVFSAANNALYLVRNGNLIEYKPDKQPVGIGAGPPAQFHRQEVALQPGDHIYIFTDGYADQFGGPGGKKFKYKQFEKLFSDNCLLPPEQQKQILSQTFNSWKGMHEQVDDVCVVGLRV